MVYGALGIYTVRWPPLASLQALQFVKCLYKPTLSMVIDNALTQKFAIAIGGIVVSMMVTLVGCVDLKQSIENMVWLATNWKCA